MQARRKLGLDTGPGPGQTSDKRVGVELEGLLSVGTGRGQCLGISAECHGARRSKKDSSAQLEELDQSCVQSLSGRNQASQAQNMNILF